MKKIIFLMLFLPFIALADSEIIDGVKKIQPHDGFTVGGDVSFTDSIAVGNPASVVDTSYPLSFYRLDSNGDVIGGVSTNASNLTDGSQHSTVNFKMRRAGALTTMNGPWSLESLSTGIGQTVVVYGTSELTSGNDSTDEAGTLGSGQYPGQIKSLRLVTDGGDDWDLTITSHETEASEVATFDAANEYLVLLWSGTEWVTLSNTCTFP